MTASKRSASDEKDLKATVKKLRSRLDKAEANAKRWKKEARRQTEAAAQSDRQVAKLTRRLEKASRSAESSDAGSGSEAALPKAMVTPMATAEIPRSDATSPDPTWTVLQLRAEARSRGLTGLSRKSKAELLSALG